MLIFDDFAMDSGAFLSCNGLFIPSESGTESLVTIMGLSFVNAVFTFGNRTSKDQTPIIHFPPKPAVIAVRRDRRDDDPGSNGDGVEYKSLRELVESRCSSLFTEFRPIWYLFRYVAHCCVDKDRTSPMSNLKWSFTNHLLRIW